MEFIFRKFIDVLLIFRDNIFNSPHYNMGAIGGDRNVIPARSHSKSSSYTPQNATAHAQEALSSSTNINYNSNSICNINNTHSNSSNNSGSSNNLIHSACLSSSTAALSNTNIYQSKTADININNNGVSGSTACGNKILAPALSNMNLHGSSLGIMATNNTTAGNGAAVINMSPGRDPPTPIQEHETSKNNIIDLKIIDNV